MKITEYFVSFKMGTFIFDQPQKVWANDCQTNEKVNYFNCKRETAHKIVRSSKISSCHIWDFISRSCWDFSITLTFLGILKFAKYFRIIEIAKLLDFVSKILGLTCDLGFFNRLGVFRDLRLAKYFGIFEIAKVYLIFYQTCWEWLRIFKSFDLATLSVFVLPDKPVQVF